MFEPVRFLLHAIPDGKNQSTTSESSILLSLRCFPILLGYSFTPKGKIRLTLEIKLSWLELQDAVSWFGYASIASILLYIIVYQIGIGPIPFFIGSELFELGPRPAAMAFGSISSWGCSFIVGMLFPAIQSIWGAFVFMPCSIACFLLTILVQFYLPETRGRQVSDVAALVSKGFRSKVL